MKKQHLNIYEYTEYRKYLNDYYDIQKENNPVFSHRYFMQKAGYNSLGLFAGILKGTSNLSQKMVPKFAKAIKLTKHEQEYLSLMVHVDNAKTEKMRTERLERLIAFIPVKKHKTLQQYQKLYYKHWYNVAIRESLCILDVDDSNLNEIAQFLNPAIKLSEVTQALDTLYQLGLIEKNELGFWKASDPLIRSGSEVGPAVIQNYQVNMMRMGERSITSIPREDRSISSLTFGISKDRYELFLEKLNKLKEEMFDKIETDSDEEYVYQFNMQFFPLTQKK
ncbi:MAG: TIGR02147 family protein [Fibrobacterales bacterium]